MSLRRTCLLCRGTCLPCLSEERDKTEQCVRAGAHEAQYMQQRWTTQSSQPCTMLPLLSQDILQTGMLGIHNAALSPPIMRCSTTVRRCMTWQVLLYQLMARSLCLGHLNLWKPRYVWTGEMALTAGSPKAGGKLYRLRRASLDAQEYHDIRLPPAHARHRMLELFTQLKGSIQTPAVHSVHTRVQ